jgi:transcriptional regulator with XRE-family HTH domain
MDRPALETMAGQVKAARTAKGLSQRALSGRTGIPQSHISKIENAGSDIRISSMLMIAHALDLELTLVPRKLMKAIEGLQRTAETPKPAYQLDEEEDDA